tara:strand:- start:543 stop:806 length:264 start_codon:yes stop_codon:yes gene_type:complete
MLRLIPKLRKTARDNKKPKRTMILPVTLGIFICIIAEYKNQERRPAIEIKALKRKLSVYKDAIKSTIADAGIKKPIPTFMLSFILIY